MSKLLIKDRAGKYEELLNHCIEPETAILDWEKNSNYEVDFTAFDDHSLQFNLLSVENTVIVDGQDFVIKNCDPSVSGSTHTIDVKAVHVGYECNYVRTEKEKTGDFGFTPQGILDFVFKDNTLGFSHEVKGNFDPVMFNNMGKCSGKDALSKITDSWKNASYMFDNKHIIVCSEDEFSKDKGNVINYYHDTTEVKLSIDSTDIQNIAKVYPKEKEAEPDTSTDTDTDSDDSTSKDTTDTTDTEDKPPEYIFEPFDVRDDDSIERFGEKRGESISDDTSQTEDDARKYALSQMQTEPAVTLTATYYGDVDFDKGEKVLLNVAPLDFQTEVTVAGIKTPLLTFQSVKEITFNNKVKSYFDIDNSSKNVITNLISSAMSQSGASGSTTTRDIWEVGEVN